VRRSRRRGFWLADDDCLFCKLYAEGDHVATTDGFVAVRDINPQAATHLLVIPEHHIASFHEIARLDAAEDKRMLDFIAEVAAREGLNDYRVVVNAGAGAGQTIFHLHWHILGGGLGGKMA
jgi:histidine triad (HIT) family protein